MIWVTEANPLPGYRLQLRFSNGKTGQVSLQKLIFSDHRQIVAALRDEAIFAACHVQHDTVVWDSGFDLAPEFLYEQLQSAAAT